MIMLKSSEACNQLPCRDNSSLNYICSKEVFYLKTNTQTLHILLKIAAEYTYFVHSSP